MNIKVSEVKERMTVYFEQELKEGNFLEVQDPHIYGLSSFSKFAIAAEVINPKRREKRDGKAVMYWIPVENKWYFSNSICFYPCCEVVHQHVPSSICIWPRYKAVNQHVPKAESKYLKLEVLSEDEISLNAKENNDFPDNAADAVLKLRAYALTAGTEWEKSLFWKRDMKIRPASIDCEIPGYVYFEDKVWKYMLVNDHVQVIDSKLPCFSKEAYDVWYTGIDGRRRKYHFDGVAFLLRKIEPLSVANARKIAKEQDMTGFIAYGMPIPVRDNDECYWLIGAIKRDRKKVLINVNDGMKEIFSDVGFAKQFYTPEPDDPNFVYD